MPGNMNNLMKQAQKMQRQMEENQKALEEAEFKSTSGGGAVEVTVNGKKEVTKLTIDPEAVDPEDVEMLEDMIIAALNEASVRRRYGRPWQWTILVDISPRLWSSYPICRASGRKRRSAWHSILSANRLKKQRDWPPVYLTQGEMCGTVRAAVR